MIKSIAILFERHQEGVLNTVVVQVGLNKPDKYGILHQAWDMNALTEPRTGTLNPVRHCIENEICILETDFTKFRGG